MYRPMSIKPVFRKIAKMQRSYVPLCRHTTFCARTPARMHVAFVDLKAAFDSVDRLALWKALRGIGIPQYLLQLIEDCITAPHPVSGSVILSPPVSSPRPVSDRAVFSLLICSAAQLIGSWSVSPPELVFNWATTTSLTWIMQMTFDVVLFAHLLGALEVFETTASQLGFLAEDEDSESGCG